MGISGDLEMTGIAEAKLALEKMHAGIEDAVANVGMPAAVAIIADESRTNCPVGDAETDPHPGALKASIRTRVKVEKGKWVTGDIIAGGKNAYWAGWVELGHFVGREGNRVRKYVKPNPFMRRSFDAKKDAALARLQSAVADVVDAMGI